MTRLALPPVHRILLALDSLSYWTASPPRRRVFAPPMSPLDQMYAYWRADPAHRPATLPSPR